jgi:dienelactone hydrolase
VADVVLFHHAQGLTDGVREFADRLRSAGHRVTVPDLFEGRTFATIEDGVGYAGETGFDTIIERGRLAAEHLPADLIYAGFSLGVLPAQMLAQTRPGARGSHSWPADSLGYALARRSASPPSAAASVSP